MSLVACPFCREMFEHGEERHCPVCGVPLQDLAKLPPSLDALAEDDEVPVAPEREPLGLTYMRRGRGLITLVGLLGIGLFFLPWIRMTLPYETTISGFEMARGRLGWVWAAGIAWLVLLPTVLSRTTILELRGARVAAAFLSAIPGVTATILLALPPGAGRVPIRFAYGWPLWATLAASLIGLALGVRLGGRIDDIKVVRGTSAGQALH